MVGKLSSLDETFLILSASFQPLDETFLTLLASFLLWMKPS